MLCHSVPLTVLLMDLYEIRGGRLGVISEEAEHQEIETDLSTMQALKEKVSHRRARATLQKSISHEEGECSSPSPTGAEDGCSEEFQEGIAVRMLLTASQLNQALI